MLYPTQKKSKEIRFIDPYYNEMFRIEDGHSIILRLNDGTVVSKICKYVDDYHFQMYTDTGLYERTFHICEFAEFMVKICAQVAPVE